MAAIPDFVSGAMENWGLITFRESRLLFDEKSTSALKKVDIIQVVAHEIAHMWFGNLGKIHFIFVALLFLEIFMLLI